MPDSMIALVVAIMDIIVIIAIKIIAIAIIMLADIDQGDDGGWVLLASRWSS